MSAKTAAEKVKAAWPFMVPSRKYGDQAPASAAGPKRAVQGHKALDLAPDVFTWDDPQAIAQSLKNSADLSERRRNPAFQSAMSVLTFYINRIGHQLSETQRDCLEAAKDELRALCGRSRHGQPLLDAEKTNKRGASGVIASPAKHFTERRSSPGS